MLMVLHPQQLAEVGSRSNILHQQIILLSAMMHQSLLMSLLEESAK